MTVEGKIPVGETGKILDTTIVTQDDGTETHREVVVNGDPDDNSARANVRKIENGDDYASLTMDRQLIFVSQPIKELVNIQRGMLKLLEAAFGDEFSGR